MKKQILPGCAAAVFSLVAAIGSVSFLGPCVHEDGTIGACHWAGQALLGTGLAAFAISLAAVLFRKARFGLYLGMVPVCLLGILTPGTLIGLCRMDTMRCRAVMQPATILLFAAAGLAAMWGAAACAREKNGKSVKRP